MDTRTYNGFTYQRSAPGEPWTLVGPAAASSGPTTVVTKRASPTLDLERPKAQAELAQSQTSQAHTALENTRMQAQAPYVQRQAAAETARAEADAVMAQQKADAQKAETALATMTASSDLHGDAYLQKYVPPAMRETVKAYARGDVGSRSGGLSTSMLPIIQHALNYDPSASATTFPARVKMHADLAGSQPGTAGGALRAMERMLLHGREVLSAGQDLNNFGPGMLGAAGNYIRTKIEQASDDPKLSRYNELVRNYAPEAQKAIAQTSGGVNERHERGDAFGPALSQASRVAALQGDARQAFDAMGAVNSQYKRLMGRDIIDQLSPEAKHAYDIIMAGGYDEKGKPLHAASGYVPGSAFGDTPSAGGGGPVGPGSSGDGGFGARFSPTDSKSGSISLATGTTTTERDTRANSLIDSMIRRGASPEEINSQLARVGQGAVNPADITAAQDYLRKNPGYKGSFADATREVATTGMNQFAASAAGAGLTAASDAVNPFNGDLSGNRNEYRLARSLLRSEHPIASTIGDLTGGTLAAVGAEAGAGAAAARLGINAGLAARVAPRVGDALYGAAAGGGNAEDGNRVTGALTGAVVSPIAGLLGAQIAKPIAAGLRAIPGAAGGMNAAGNAFGKVANAAGNAVRGARGEAPVAFQPNILDTGPEALSSGREAISKALMAAGPDDVSRRLAQAQGLGIPMSLADAHPALTSIAGAAVRRSPEADSIAQAAFMPRSRGQIDRLGSAVERDLGPVQNIPQLSADMTAQAQAAAGPLYVRAYANPVPGTPELSATLDTPFGRQALGRAQTIAANERRAPSELGFAQDAEGNTILNPQPNQAIAQHLGARAELDAAQQAYREARTGTGNIDAARSRVEAARENMRSAEQSLAASPDPTQAASVPNYTTQTLDYVKRGMDDVLEEHRNPLTGRLVLDEAGGAQNQVKNQFLGEVDRLNPAYADARSAYAGPVQARDAMVRGQDAFSANPNELGIQVANQTPEHLAQMQLGYRSELMDRANAVRYSTNPFEATLGTPAAEQRLSTLYPDNPSVANLLSQRDMERQLAGTTNEIMGNSRTAQRQIADQAFRGDSLSGMALEQGINAATGGVPVGTVAKSLLASRAFDSLKAGMSAKAVAKADEMAPILFNTDPSAASESLAAIVNAAQARREYLMRLNQAAGTRGGVIGAAGGSSIAAMLAAGQ